MAVGAFCWSARNRDSVKWHGPPARAIGEGGRAHPTGGMSAGGKRPLDPRHRIEINAELVRMIEIVGAHRMRVKLEAGEVGHPHERRRVAGHDLLRAAA